MPRVTKLSGTKDVLIGYLFRCPGCEEFHTFDGNWAFNGDMDRPTFTPSLIVTWTDHRCHSFVTDGRIQFLADCTHSLKGQTVDLPDMDHTPVVQE